LSPEAVARGPSQSRTLAWTVLAFLMTIPDTAVSAEDASRDAAAAVRILKTRCVSCHGPDEVEGELRLDTRDGFLVGGVTGALRNDKEPMQSLMLRAIRHEQPELEMPPKDKLPAAEIALLTRWFLSGAPWPESTITPTGDGPIGDAWTDPRNPIAKLWGGQRLDLWSLRPVGKVEPPATAHNAWCRTGVDRFIAASLESAKLVPSVEADRRTLIRRLSFDLIGLPPTPAEVEAFVADPAPEAYERIVERLLASPHYGEHQARWWLDVVRYSDSNGFDWDEFRPAAWRFRDYVVRSFNADKSFAQFVREQLAGDELLSGPPTNADEQDCLIATGYLRLGPQDNAAGLFNEQDRGRAEWLADLTETTGSAFLGLTLSCCRCHDHKFDPLSQADHFRLRAFFAPIKYGDAALDLATEQEEIRRVNAEVDREVAALEQQRSALTDPIRERLRQERRQKLSSDDLELLDRADEQVADGDKPRRKKLMKQVEPPEKDVSAALTDEQKPLHESLHQQIAEGKRRSRPLTKGWIATDDAGEVPTMHVLYQGDHKSPRDAVVPGFLSALAPQDATIAKGTNPETHGRRLTLADWIVSPDNPFTARVLVNRVWQSHFGQGLVATPNDFGLAGSRPTHPELLDWLAAEFVQQGGSLKALHRTIVTSAVYRQASFRTDSATLAVDPRSFDANNQFYWRQNPRRLSAEQLRDALLVTSGLLQSTLGGPPVWPELPAEILQANPAFLDDNETKTKGWYPSPAARQGVRSLYLIQKRTVKVPLLETFDLPENSVSCAARSTSTVAPQALTLLNNPLAIEAAQALADRVRAEAGSHPERQIVRAFAWTLQREPTADELRACRSFLESQSLPALCRGLINLNEFVWID
ncbi:MAG TPA: PSD1 and planctomycete cytochrome C domain-containing protein, partial [Planctomycetaceae bacterium]|nr:PSD1 and planctomycete cytochrome C domain-containing protein [Planctomycetaceae bacterium]